MADTEVLWRSIDDLVKASGGRPSRSAHYQTAVACIAAEVRRLRFLDREGSEKERDGLRADNLELTTANARICGERDEARDWVRRMHSESQVLTCVYCGHAYPPGTPASGSEALTAHVAVCSKHPMAPLRAFVQELADDWTRDGRRGDHPGLAKAAFDLLNPEVPHG